MASQVHTARSQVQGQESGGVELRRGGADGVGRVSFFRSLSFIPRRVGSLWRILSRGQIFYLGKCLWLCVECGNRETHQKLSLEFQVRDDADQR